jgi:hypothetical protein
MEVVMTRLTPIAFVVLLLALPGHAAAQTSQLAVDGTVLVGADSRDSRLPSLIRGGGLNVVNFLSPRLSLGLEVDVPEMRADESTGRTPHADGSATVFFVRRTFRGTTTAAVVGFHFIPGHRVDVAMVTGLGIERRSFGASIYQDSVDASGVVRAHTVIDTSGPPNTDVFHWLQVPLGLDAAIALGSHLSLVPEFRFYFDPMAPLNDGCCDGWQSRMRLAVRWRF